MQNDVKLENFLFRGIFSIKKKSAIEKLLKNNHKNRTRPKYFNKNTDTSKKATPRAEISWHQPKLNSVRFEDPYYHTVHMYNTHEYTNLIFLLEKNIEDAEVEQEELFEDKNDNMITEE